MRYGFVRLYGSFRYGKADHSNCLENFILARKTQIHATKQGQSRNGRFVGCGPKILTHKQRERPPKTNHTHTHTHTARSKATRSTQQNSVLVRLAARRSLSLSLSHTYTYIQTLSNDRLIPHSPTRWTLTRHGCTIRIRHCNPTRETMLITMTTKARTMATTWTMKILMPRPSEGISVNS